MPAPPGRGKWSGELRGGTPPKVTDLRGPRGMNGTRSRLPGCPATPSRSQSGKTIRLVRWGLAEPAIPQNPKESSPCSGLSLEEREDEDVVLGEFRRFLSFGWSSGFYFLSFFFFF